MRKALFSTALAGGVVTALAFAAPVAATGHFEDFRGENITTCEAAGFPDATDITDQVTGTEIDDQATELNITDVPEEFDVVAVIVKGGPNTRVYNDVYENMTAPPLDPDADPLKYPALSHWEVCAMTAGGGDNGDEAGGDNGDEAGGDNGDEAGGDNGDEAGGDNGDEAGGDNGDEAGGDNGADENGADENGAGGDNGVDEPEKEALPDTGGSSNGTLLIAGGLLALGGAAVAGRAALAARK